MPTLREVQKAMHGSLVAGDDGAMTAFLADPAVVDRINIYRNTFLMGLTKALQLCFPAVQRLVGGEFFDGVAQHFVTQHPPREAYLNHYGADFPAFLGQFQPAASLPYLPDVARLEWAVNGALHCVDTDPLDLQRLALVPPDEQGRLRLVGHPSVHLLRLDYPADAIWRAVLAEDDRQLGAIDIEGGPVHLLVERGEGGVQVVRLETPAWQFAERLLAGDPIELALDTSVSFDASAALADHFASGRFISFELAPRDVVSHAHQ
jgi:hypothetical protein